MVMVEMMVETMIVMIINDRDDGGNIGIAITVLLAVCLHTVSIILRVFNTIKK